MLSDIVSIHPRTKAVAALVAECFDGYAIPSDDWSVWVGHVFDGLVASVGALGFYRGRPDAASLHTCCVHPDFRGFGFQRELVQRRIEMARNYDRPQIIVNPTSGLSRSNLAEFGFMPVDVKSATMMLVLDGSYNASQR